MIPQAAQPTPPAPSYPYRYQQLEPTGSMRCSPGWPLPTGRSGAPNWADHAEAHIRLEVLWHTWEAAMAAAPDTDPQWAAVDEWLRVRLDHHVDKLLDVDGPFAGCIPARGIDPGRCSAPAALAQRPLVLAATPPPWPASMRPPGWRPTRPVPAGTRRSPIMSYPQPRSGLPRSGHVSVCASRQGEADRSTGGWHHEHAGQR